MKTYPDNYSCDGQINLMDWLREEKPEALPQVGEAKSGVLPCKSCLRSKSCTAGSGRIHFDGTRMICEAYLPEDFMNKPEAE